MLTIFFVPLIALYWSWDVQEFVTASGDGGMVASDHVNATLVGVEILQAGGTAVDAGYAVFLMLNLLQPWASGIGGGGFFTYYHADSGETIALDFREEAPNDYFGNVFCANETIRICGDSCTCEEAVSWWDRRIGGVSVGTPTSLRAFEEMRSMYGKMSFKDIAQPTIEMARTGFEMSDKFYRNILRWRDDLLTFDEATKMLFLDPHNSSSSPIAEVGEMLTNDDFAGTLELLVEEGIECFYQDDCLGGEIIDALSGDRGRNPVTNLTGLMTINDLSGSDPVRRYPVTSTYKNFELRGMNMPTSGCTSIMMMLDLMESHDENFAETYMYGSGEWATMMYNIQNNVWADRNEYMADADFVDVPLDILLDNQTYTDTRAALLTDTPTIYSPGAGDIEHGTQGSVVADANGNVFSIVTTIEMTFGSGIVVPGRGFFLNNQLTDFSGLPYSNGKLVANRPQGGKQTRRTAVPPEDTTSGGKRPRSSTCPMLVFNITSGEAIPFMAISGSGGSNIIGSIFNVLVNVLEYGLDLQEAIYAPRVWGKGGSPQFDNRLDTEEFIAAYEDGGNGDASAVNFVDPGSYGVNALLIGSDGMFYGGTAHQNTANARALGLDKSSIYKSKSSGWTPLYSVLIVVCILIICLCIFAYKQSSTETKKASNVVTAI